jgi:hypothetical protein
VAIYSRPPDIAKRKTISIKTRDFDLFDPFDMVGKLTNRALARKEKPPVLALAETGGLIEMYVYLYPCLGWKSAQVGVTRICA